MFEWVNLISAIMAGLGVGTLIPNFIQIKKDKKKFLYEKKLTTYTGYLESLTDVINSGTNVNKQKVVYWTMHLKLIAPNEISDIAVEFFKDGSTGIKFTELREKLVEKMAVDLRQTF